MAEPSSHQSLEITDLKHLQDIAHQIGKSLQDGDVIFLEGSLGAGKTTFSQFLIQFLMEKTIDVPSPTFSLVNVYETSLFPIWHFDLYRLEKSEELFQIGIEDALVHGVLLIEWPSQGQPLLPKPTLTLRFSLQGEDRFLEIIS